LFLKEILLYGIRDNRTQGQEVDSVGYNNKKWTQYGLKFSKLMIMTMQQEQISETLQQGWLFPA
jgi:hypothetical protein